MVPFRWRRSSPPLSPAQVCPRTCGGHCAFPCSLHLVYRLRGCSSSRSSLGGCALATGCIETTPAANFAEPDLAASCGASIPASKGEKKKRKPRFVCRRGAAFNAIFLLTCRGFAPAILLARNVTVSHSRVQNLERWVKIVSKVHLAVSWKRVSTRPRASQVHVLYFIHLRPSRLVCETGSLYFWRCRNPSHSAKCAHKYIQMCTHSALGTFFFLLLNIDGGQSSRVACRAIAFFSWQSFRFSPLYFGCKSGGIAAFINCCASSLRVQRATSADSWCCSSSQPRWPCASRPSAMFLTS